MSQSRSNAKFLRQVAEARRALHALKETAYTVSFYLDLDSKELFEAAFDVAILAQDAQAVLKEFNDQQSRRAA